MASIAQLETTVSTGLLVRNGPALFPSPTGSDYFYLTLEQSSVREIVKCTARATDALTIVRAQQGTSAAAFTAGARVELRLTKQSLEDLQSVGSVTAAYASRPAAGVSGRLFLPNNGFVVERDTSSVWAPWGPLFPFTAPVDGDFSWANQGSASVTTTNGQIHLSVPASATSSLRVRDKAAPSVPYVITAGFLINLIPVNTIDTLGLVFGDGTKYHSFGVGYSSGVDGGYYLLSGKWTTATAYGVNYTATPFSQFGPVVWLRIADDNTNRICSISSDGINFIPFHSVGRTDHLTATRVGWAGSVQNASNPAGLTKLSWKEA